MKVDYPGSTVPGELPTPVTYTLWIPDGVSHLRAIIVHQHGAGTTASIEGSTAAHDLHWQALARKWDCALFSSSYHVVNEKIDLSPGGSEVWFDPRHGSEKVFLHALDEFAEKSGHAEIATVPWALWGHSGGGIWADVMSTLHPDRIAVIWMRSGSAIMFRSKPEFPQPQVPAAVYGIPSMCNPGVKEKPNIPWTGTLETFREYRAKGAPIGFAPDPRTGHECGDSRYLAIPFFDACLAMRLPDKDSKDQTLKPADMSKAWLASWPGGVPTPAASYKGDPSQAVWLPSEAVAKAWAEYVETGAVSDATAPPAPYDVKALPKGDLGTEITWNAEADFESGIRCFVVLRDGRQAAQVPQTPVGKFGRPLFQSMTYHDTPSQPMPEMRYLDTEAKAGQQHTYSVITVNSVGLKSEPSVPATTASSSCAAPRLAGVGAAMQAAVDARDVAGAVTVVVTRDEVLHLEATGLADIAEKKPMQPDSRFWIASMTKPVTAVAVLMLQDEGKLNVADPVAKYIPAFADLKTPSGKPANLTISQILTHTSGLGEAPAVAACQAHTLADLVPLWLAAPMQYEPGAKWQYTQSGINLAARIVEVVSGMSFDAFVQQRILDPLGMKNTTFYPEDGSVVCAYAKNRTTGELEPTPRRSDFGTRGHPPLGNGGLYSTGPDYARFCQMLLAGGALDGKRYLSADAMKFFTTVQTGDLPCGFFQSAEFGNHGANYGWGIGTCILRKPHEGVAAMLSPGTYGHGGAWGTQAWIDPVRGVAYVLMVQRSNFPNSDASSVRRAFQQAAADALAKQTRPAAESMASPSDQAHRDMVLWYRQPGVQWLDAMPIGNGLMGAMVFGGVPQERIALNESSFWSGRPHDYNDPNAFAYFFLIRDLVFAGKFQEAEKMADEHFYGVPAAQQAYEPLGDLLLDFDGAEAVRDYRRQLDMETGVATVTYRAGDAALTREVFVSYPDKVMVVHISADKPGRVSVGARFKSPYLDRVTTSPDQLVMDGCWKGPMGDNWLIAAVRGKGIRFETVLRAFPQGGRCEADGDTLRIRGADVVTFVVAAATSHVNYKNISGDPAAICKNILARAADKDFATLRRRHEADFSALMGRVHLAIGDRSMNETPADERLEAMRRGREDVNLEALCFQFGRYILASSSRAGGQPANLQAIWNENILPNWGSKYTININTEMNYWPAEVCNLSECHQPLFDMLKDISITGAETARVYYGCGGWVAHHNIDLWRGTAPVDAARFGMWPMGGAWLTLHLWEHYAFTGDRRFLEGYYPIMKGSARFFLDLLTEEPTHHWLVTPFSMSPEHGYLDAKGNLAFLSPAPTLDIAIMRELFPQCIEASKLLGVDEDLRARLEAALTKLPPYQINRRGFVQEWIEDWQPGNQGHNVSPQFAFYPGSTIQLRRDPQLADAERKWMDTRHSRGGWPAAWDICMWARLEQGDKVAECIRTFVSNSVAANLHNRGSNQSDASFGFTAGVAESLLQSHADEISLLPALPTGWTDGSVKGLRARGGFEVDMQWADGRLRTARIRSDNTGPCRVRYGDTTATVQMAAGRTVALNANLTPQADQPK